MPELSKDRREYFRIIDTLALDFQPIEENLNPEEPRFPFQRSASVFSLIDKIQQTQGEGETILRLIHDENRRVASYLKNIDKRVNYLSQMLLENNPEIQALNQFPASLSEGGLAFITDEPIGTEQYVALKILLLPEHVGLFASARCISSERSELGWENALTFTAISELDKKLLARHIVKVQAQERRQAARARLQEQHTDEGEI